MNIILIILLLGIIGILFWALRDEKPSSGRSFPGDSDNSEDTFRRRKTDREIEEEYPAREPLESNRRHDDIDDEIEDAPLEIPYSAEEIISDKSRYKVYKRTLMNAEIYAQKGDFTTAISLYSGVSERINDSDARHKININTEYLKNFQKKKKENAEKRAQIAKKSTKQEVTTREPNEITLKLDGEIPSSINIGITNPDDLLSMDKISDMVREQLKDELSEFMSGLNNLQNANIGQSIPLDSKEIISDLKNDLNQIETLQDSIQNIASKMDNSQILENLANELSQISNLKDKLDNSLQSDEISNASNTLKSQLEKIGSFKNNLDNLENLDNELNKIKELKDNLNDITSQEVSTDALNQLQKELNDINDLKNKVKSISSDNDSSNMVSALNNELQNLAQLKDKLHDLSTQPIDPDEISSIIQQIGRIPSIGDQLKSISSQEDPNWAKAELKQELGQLEDLSNKLEETIPPEKNTKSSETLKQQLKEISSLENSIDDLVKFDKELDGIKGLKDNLQSIDPTLDPRSALSELNQQVNEISDLEKHVDSIMPNTGGSNILDTVKNELKKISGMKDKINNLKGSIDPSAMNDIQSELQYISTLKDFVKNEISQGSMADATAALESELGHISSLKDKLDDLIHPENESTTAQKLKEQLQSISSQNDKSGDEISKLKDKLSETQGINADNIKQLQQQLDNAEMLKDRLDEMLPKDQGIGDFKKLYDKLGRIVDSNNAQSEINSLKDQIKDLQEQLSDLSKSKIPESEKQPAATEARFDSSPGQNLDSEAIKKLLDKIPDTSTGQAAPSGGTPGGTPSLQGGQAPFSGGTPPTGDTGKGSPAFEPGQNTSSVEKKIQKFGDDDSEFELMKDYGHDDYMDSMSDDDVFEKILSDDKKNEETQDSFEIIGDRKMPKAEEYSVTDPSYERRMREEERFYKNILTTGKRKRKELPILKVSYDFSRLPDEFSLSKDKNIIEYAFYKYKPMLERANQFIKQRRVRDALNYYKVVMSQNIPPEFKAMIRKNINDLTEYLENYLTFD